jgi:uncharacterized membrane protein required for colicin V production
MNTFDIACLVFLLIALLLGFFQGAVRMLVIAVVSYICFILAGLYFLTFGDQLHLSVDFSIMESYVLAFIGVFLACLITLSSMGVYTFRLISGNPSATLNRVFGVVASVFTMGVLLGAFAHLVMMLATTDMVPGSRTLIGTPEFIELVRSARLAKPLADAANSLLVVALDPFVFSDINQLFPPPTP